MNAVKKKLMKKFKGKTVRLFYTSITDGEADFVHMLDCDSYGIYTTFTSEGTRFVPWHQISEMHLVKGDENAK